MVNVDAIREKAEAFGLSLTQLESKAGVANGVIGQWKTGSPNMETLQKVTKVLNCTIDELLID